MKQFVPHKYQEPICALMKEKPHFGVFAFPGSGKTVMTLDMIYDLRMPTLIIAPLEIMYTTWSSEPLKWDFSHTLRYNILHGKDKGPDFFKKQGVQFINPEGIPWLLEQVKRTKRFPWKVLVIDESIKFKNHKSVRFKALAKLLKTFERRYILSGNPMPNSYLDIWAQVFILDLGQRLGTSWYSFRNKYFYPTDYKRFNWELKPGAQDDIIALISDITYFLDVDDEIDLPEVLEVDIPVILPAQAMKKYKKMEVDLFTELDQGENILAPNKTASLMKCWQIANGFIYQTDDDDKRTTHFIHNELAVAAKAHADSLQGRPLLIAYHFKEDLERLKKEFPTARIAQSGISKGELRAIEADWNNDKIEVLLAYISKLSHGLNLQLGSGHNILVYCLTYNYDVYDQLIFRFKRQGAKFGRVVVHRLISQGTMHHAILESLDRKETDSKGFLHALKDYRLNVLQDN